MKSLEEWLIQAADMLVTKTTKRGNKTYYPNNPPPSAIPSTTPEEYPYPSLHHDPG